jgi:hypothetical protein
VRKVKVITTERQTEECVTHHDRDITIRTCTITIMRRKEYFPGDLLFINKLKWKPTVCAFHENRAIRWD